MPSDTVMYKEYYANISEALPLPRIVAGTEQSWDSRLRTISWDRDDGGVASCLVISPDSSFLPS